MSLLVVKALLLITWPACSLLILAPLYYGPPPDWIRVAFALALPPAMWAFYRLIKCAVINATLNEIDRRRGRASSSTTNARYRAG